MPHPSSSTTSATSATERRGGGLASLARVALAAAAIRPFVKGLVGLEVHGAGNLPARDPFLLVANHDSHLDTLVLLSLFPLGRLGRIRPVAAADYWLSSPLKRFAASACLNVLPVVRGARAGDDPLAPLSAALARGESLILFPEGTRGEPEVLERFKTGAARLALAHPEVPLVPVYLAGSGRSLPRGTALFVPLVVRVAIGEPLALSGTPREATARLEEAVRALGREVVPEAAGEAR